MRVLFINSVCGIRSTGRICTDLAEEYMKQGHEVRIAYGRETVPEKYKDIAVKIGSKSDVYSSVIRSRIFNNDGFNSISATKKFLEWAEKYDPDILWLHNLHGYYVNIDLLFKWIKSRPEMQVKWTLHDCWAFTGHCAHFTMAKCEKWKTGCFSCPQKRSYPKSIVFDRCGVNYRSKQKAFCGVENMTLITPSHWLRGLVKQSFLKEYKVDVVHNTIDREIFRYRESNFRTKYGLENKKIVLGVSTVWNETKGLGDYIRLPDLLSNDYKVVLVGVPEKLIKKLPGSILAFEKTNNVAELAEIYSATDVFINLTYEDNYPTVNLEAQACGTPCITYRTGGSPESVPPENVADTGNLDEIVVKIKEICEMKK